MSEHDSHDDESLSALYRRTAREEPSAQLDARVLAAARHHAARRQHRWWLPLSTAAVVVLAVGLLLRHQQRPDELQPQVTLDLAERPVPNAARPLPAEKEQSTQSAAGLGSAPARKPLAGDARASAPVAPPALQAEMAPSPVLSPQTAGNIASSPTEAESSAPATDMAKASAAPRGVAPSMEGMAEAKKRETVAPEPAEPWLKRIDALLAKGEIEAARRELVAFRKVYPTWPLPKELQALLPEAAK